MRRLVLAVAVTFLASAGCSSDSGPPSYDGETVLGCAEWLDEAPTIEQIDAGCWEPGDVYIEGHHQRCGDGRTLYWSRFVWGWLGEPGEQRLDNEEPPAEALAECEAA